MMDARMRRICRVVGWCLLLVLCGVLLGARTPTLSTLSSIQVSRRQQAFAIVCRFNAPPRAHAFMLKNPNRLVLDINGSVWRGKVSSLLWRGTPIKQMREGRTATRLRLVFDLKQAMRLSPAIQSGLQKKKVLFIWLHPIKQSPIEPKAKNTQSKQSLATVPVSRDAIGDLAASLVPRKTVIVIDPGHGGKDPGATGVRGIHEKNVVLKISKNIYRLINHTPGFRAYLTRYSDRYLTLRQRLAIARRYHADMFVAIHADAFDNPRASGASVFALSTRGATSEAARWLAARENASELIGGVDLVNKDRMLKSVLIDLSQAATIRKSLDIGAQVIAAIKPMTHLHHVRVEQAAFVVLKSPDIPSLLIETGFLSNRKEALRLNRSGYQLQLATAIARGMTQYFIEHPLPNTWLAWQKQSKRLVYHVKFGDSLSVIAARYEISAKALRRANQLVGDRLAVGQTLLIPKS